MKTNPNNLAIYSLKNRRERIDPKPQYQRGAVWSEKQKQLLIDSILRGYDIPKVYLRVLGENSEFEHEVVDGQQRLRAIWEFLSDGFPLGDDSKDFDDLPDLTGKYFSDLNSDQQDRIGSFNLSITEIRHASDIEIRELFLRLQEGKTLNPAEKRNAMVSNLRDFVADLAKHKVFSCINKKNTRFLYDDWAAHVVALELADGATDLKANDLKKFYEKESDFNVNSKKAAKIKRVFNFLSDVLKDRPPEMSNKWGFVDLYFLVSHMMDNYSISNRENDFFSFFVGFEQERRRVEDPAELLMANPSEWDKDLYDYIDSFQKDGAKRENLKTRHEIYLRKILYDFSDFEFIDTKRRFNENERIIIWRRANQKCQLCGKKLKFAEMAADHFFPYSLGGKTTLKNAQCLCVSCNSSKGNTVV
jgi:hypothetical protein